MNKNYLKIYLALFLAMFVFYGLSGLFSSRAKESNDGFLKSVLGPIVEGASDLEKVDEKFEITEKITKVEVKASTGSITVRASADGKTHVSFSGFAAKRKEGQKFGYKISNGELSVKENVADGFEVLSNFIVRINDDTVSSSVPRLDIVIEIPRDSGAKLQMQSVGGTIKVDRLNLLDLFAKSVNGDIEVREVTLEEIGVKAVDGSILVEEVKTDRAEAETVSGEIFFQIDSPKVEAKTVSGDLRIAFPEGRQLDLKWKTVSGDVKNDYPSKAGGKAGAKIEAAFKTVSGDLHVHSVQKSTN
jgi:DUF4097 and DUF4098 domain-containing protein YvlB